MEKLKVLVMYATDYSIKDEDSGRVNEGCTIQYYNLGNNGELLQQIGSVSGRPDGPVGYQRAKCSADISLRKKISLLPAIYDAEMSMTVGSDGKMVLKITDLDNYQPVDFSKLLGTAGAGAKPSATRTAPAAAATT